MKKYRFPEEAFREFMKKQEITDNVLQALVDNQFGHEQRHILLSALETDERARERYEQLLNQKSMIKLWWIHGARDH